MPGIRSAAEECLAGARSCTDVWARCNQVRAPGSSCECFPATPSLPKDRRGFMAKHRGKLMPVRSAARQNAKADTQESWEEKKKPQPANYFVS